MGNFKAFPVLLLNRYRDRFSLAKEHVIFLERAEAQISSDVMLEKMARLLSLAERERRSGFAGRCAWSVVCWNIFDHLFFSCPK